MSLHWYCSENPRIYLKMVTWQKPSLQSQYGQQSQFESSRLHISGNWKHFLGIKMPFCQVNLTLYLYKSFLHYIWINLLPLLFYTSTWRKPFLFLYNIAQSNSYSIFESSKISGRLSFEDAKIDSLWLSSVFRVYFCIISCHKWVIVLILSDIIWYHMGPKCLMLVWYHLEPDNWYRVISEE